MSPSGDHRRQPLLSAPKQFDVVVCLTGLALMLAAAGIVASAWNDHRFAIDSSARMASSPSDVLDVMAPASASLTTAAAAVGRLPSMSDVPTLLTAIEATAVDNHLGWVAADYRLKPASEREPASLEIRTHFVGTYPQIRRMVAQVLERIPRRHVQAAQLRAHEQRRGRGRGQGRHCDPTGRWPRRSRQACELAPARRRQPGRCAMRQRRLIVLFIVMFGLTAARWWASDSSSAVPLVEAVAHPRPLSAASDRSDALSTPAGSSPALQIAALEGVATGDDPWGDPFAVRHPPQPIAPPSPPPAPTVAAPEAAPAQDAAPPFQVIGTYDDSHDARCLRRDAKRRRDRASRRPVGHRLQGHRHYAAIPHAETDRK